jgi:hypothetical protein
MGMRTLIALKILYPNTCRLLCVYCTYWQEYTVSFLSSTALCLAQSRKPETQK